MSNKTVHNSILTPKGLAALRELGAADINAIVRYWFTSEPEYLDGLGVNRSRLGTPEEIRTRLMRAIRTGDPHQKMFGLAITLNDEFAGYTILSRRTPDENYSYWHITIPSLRAGGISTALYPHRIQAYFRLAPIERLIHQTRASNIGINRMLEKYVPVAETRYVDQPEGLALPGEFHIRYVTRADLPKIIARGSELRHATHIRKPVEE